MIFSGTCYLSDKKVKYFFKAPFWSSAVRTEDIMTPVLSSHFADFECLLPFWFISIFPSSCRFIWKTEICILWKPTTLVSLWNLQPETLKSFWVTDLKPWWWVLMDWVFYLPFKKIIIYYWNMLLLLFLLPTHIGAMSAWCV